MLKSWGERGGSILTAAIYFEHDPKKKGGLIDGQRDG